MAVYVQPAPRARVIPRQFWALLKAELTPHPGMYSILTRIIISVVITFLIVATYRMPNAAISLYSVFTVDRSSRRAALLRAIESTVAITIGVALALFGVLLFAQLPLLTFAYYALELFVVAFLIRTTRLQGPAMNMGMAIYSVHNIWERPSPAEPHLESTLWVWLTLGLGFFVSVMVEFAFAREDPLAQIQAGLKGRLRALSSLFSSLAAQEPVASAHEAVLSYASVGTALIRQLIASLRNTDPAIRQELLAFNTVTAQIARLIDISATIDTAVPPSHAEAERLAALAGQLDDIRLGLDAGEFRRAADYQPPLTPSGSIPSLPELERAAALIPTAFSASESQDTDPSAQLLEPQEHFSIFIPDAFTNPGYILFALKTMIAAMLCYVIYSALDWPGIATSVVTCLVTALHTIGATKQKQLLRLTGAAFGGLLALGSLIFLLPEIDSITGVALLVAGVSAFCAWFAVASTRLSYFGLQTALAFYLALLQDYTATTQLAPARDRALGVLLGVAVMWLVFDNLWPVSAADHMLTGLARNIRLLAQLIMALDQPDRAIAIQTIRSLRERIQAGFTAVHGHADSVLFEFGSPNRTRHLMLRDSILGIQATLRTLSVVEIAISQYRTQVIPSTRPPQIREAQRTFDQAFSDELLQIAQAIENLQPVGTGVPLTEALEQYERSIFPWESTLTDDWIKTRVSGIRSLTRQAVELTGDLSKQHFWR